MTDWLLGLIPEGHRAAFEFAGLHPREHMSDALDGVIAVVVSSRFESFCLAAHEAHRLGLPVIVPDLPAFDGLFSEDYGAVVYDRTVEGLASSLRRLIDDDALASSLASRPLPQPGDTWEAYRTDPEPRHPRALRPGWPPKRPKPSRSRRRGR